MRISIRNSKIVGPGAPTPHHSLWNSNLDLVAPRRHGRILYFYRPDDSTHFFDASVLTSALAGALVAFYPLAGRLAQDENGRVEIDCSGAGALFVEAEATETTLDDLGDFAPTVKLRGLLPTMALALAHTDDLSLLPLLVLQVTYFRCGGVSLGVGMHHIVGDGFSTFHFIDYWSALARGATITVKPYIDKTLLRARDPPLPLFPHVEYQPASNLAPPTTTCHLHSTRELPPEASVRMFHLTKYHLESLRKKAALSSAHLSSFSLTAAHIWRCVCLARGLSPNDLTVMYTAADGRNRLRPPLPEGYFGNVVFTAAPVCTTAEVVAGVADKIQDTILKMDDEYCRSALDHLEVQPDLGMLARGPEMFKSNLGLTSWVSLPVYNADFGWGRPVFMGPGWITMEGLAFLLRRPAGDRSITLAISLQAEHMEVFEKLIFNVYNERL